MNTPNQEIIEATNLNVIEAEVKVTEVEKDEPLARRSVRIIYSVDSAASLLAAATLKKLVESIDKRSIAGQMYTFNIVEIADIDRLNKYNTNIWLDIRQCLEDIDSEHLVLTGNAVGHWSDSQFSDSLLAYVEAGGIVTRSMSDKDAPTCDEREASVLHYGLLINAVLALSHAAPEIEFHAMVDLIAKLSAVQNGLSKFYSKDCKTRDLLRTFAMVCAAQGELGHVSPSNLNLRVSNDPLYKRIRECDTVALSYHQLFTQARVRMTTQGVVRSSVIKADNWKGVNKVCDVVTVRMSEYFWLTRRLIQLGNKRYHNTRLTPYGLHITTDLPEGAGKFTQPMRETEAIAQ